MGQPSIIGEMEVERPSDPPVSSTFEKLQELTRHGYVPDPQPVARGDGILLRHRSAPDLILWANGTVDVPLGQPTRPAANSAPARKQRRWGRALLIFGALAIYTFISFVILIALNE